MKGDDGHVRYVSISTADKMSIPLTVTARGTSTHCSMPRPDNAIFALSRALAKLSAYETPLTITPRTKQFFSALSQARARRRCPDYFRDLVGDDPAKARRADAIVSHDPLLHSLDSQHDRAGDHQRRFPQQRHPGFGAGDDQSAYDSGQRSGGVRRDAEARSSAIRRSRSRIGDVASYARRRPSRRSTPISIARWCRRRTRQFPGAEVTPYLFQAGTDAGAWRSRGVPVYGIYPYPIDADELTRMHGNDEKVSVASLEQGTEMIYRTLVEVAGKK